MNMHKTEVPVKELRKFGFIMAIAFGVIGFLPLLKPNGELRPWAVTISVIFLNLGLIRPNWLREPFGIWMKIGHALGWVNSRIILAIIFYFLIAPIGFLLRALGKTQLKRHWDARATTYRQPTRPRPATHYERTF